MSQPETLSELYPSEWLHYSDLNGRTFTLTINHVEVRKFDQSLKPDEWRAVLSFERAEKRLICNKTQATAVSDIAQTEIFADWPGTRITLKPGLAKNKKPTIIVTPAPAPRPSPPETTMAAPTATNDEASEAPAPTTTNDDTRAQVPEPAAITNDEEMVDAFMNA